MKRSISLIIFPLIIVIAGVYMNRKTVNSDTQNIETSEQTPTQSTDGYHVHAAFDVYKDNKKVDFSDFKYMHLEPCTEENHEDSEDPGERVHLHDLVGDVAHVHAKGVTWGELFINLDYKFDSDPVGYVNGEKVDNILETEINEYDRVLILEDENIDVEQKINNIPTIDYIKEIEGKSESCGS